MDVDSTGTRQSDLDATVEEVRKSLLALSQARIAGAKLASIVNKVLPQGKTFRDLLPEDIDREAASFRDFVNQHLTKLVKLTDERQGTDIVYEIVGSGVPVGTGRGELWRAFVSVRPKLDLILDRKVGSLRVVPHPAAGTTSSHLVMPVELSEHRDICQAFFNRLVEQGVHVPQLEEIFLGYASSSYAKWLKVLRSHTPSLDREWGEFRKKLIIELFDSRVQNLGIGEKLRKNVLDQFAHDAPGSGHHSTVFRPVEPIQIVSTEILENQVRRRLHAVIDRMTLEQMNALLLPFSLFPHDPK